MNVKTQNGERIVGYRVIKSVSFQMEGAGKTVDTRK